jgi:hypothetical protein
VKKANPATTAPPGYMTKAAYIKRADTICKAFKSPLQTANNASNLPLFIKLFKREISEIEKLAPPDEDTATTAKALQDAETGLIALTQNDITTANKNLIAADTLLGIFGMKVCNYGH